MDNNNDKIDPNEFFNQRRNPLLDQINMLPNDVVNNMSENVNDTVYVDVKKYNDQSNVPYFNSDPEIEKEELARKYGISNIDVNTNVNKQAEAFMSNKRIASMLEEEGFISNSDNTQNIQNEVNNEFQNRNEYSNVRIEQTDPIIVMFKKAKRNTDFFINLKIVNKIPRLDFIEMMEDSYETSIIEYLANEFTNELLSNPNFIKEKIVNEIKSMLNKFSNDKNKVQKEGKNKEEVKDDVKNEQSVKIPRKPRATKTNS